MAVRQPLMSAAVVTTQFPEAPADLAVLLKDGQIGSGVFVITPEVAEAWLLERNTDNRPLSSATVRNYARQIAKGDWRITHQGIGFDRDGVLMDGQHRLQAIVDSETAVPMMVSWNLAREGFAALDAGRSRSANDAIALHLDEKPKNISMFVAIIRTINAHDRTLGIAAVDAPAPSNQEVIEMAEEMGVQEINDAATVAATIYRAGRTNGVPVSAAVIGAFYYMMVNRGGWDAELVESQFLTPFITGVGVSSERDPRLALRRAAIREEGGTRNTMARVEVVSMMFRAFEAWIANKEVRHILRPTTTVSVPMSG